MLKTVIVVEVRKKPEVVDAHGQKVLSDFRLAGVNNIKRVKVSSLYKLKGELTTQEIETIAKELLTDPVTQEYNVNSICHSEAKPKNLFFSAQNQNEILRSAQNDSLSKVIAIDVWLKPGVTDSVGENVVKGIKDLGINKEIRAFSGTRYVFECNSSLQNFETAVEKILVNLLIHNYKISAKSKVPNYNVQNFKSKTKFQISLRDGIA